MLNVNYTTIREVQRNYRQVADDVNKTGMPLVVISNNQPQFAIVTMNMLQDLQKVDTANSAQGLLNLATWAEQVHTKGPKDLSQNLDRYLWDN
jgi:PHD/YefM family antitoxin component YafN of YafNO toxin-antitoxin module